MPGVDPVSRPKHAASARPPALEGVLFILARESDAANDVGQHQLCVASTKTYQLTADGQRVAIYYTKVHDRLLRPLIAADTPRAPLELRRVSTTVDRHVYDYLNQARLGNAAKTQQTPEFW